MVSFKGISMVFFLVFLCFGAYKLISGTEISEQTKNILLNQTGQHPVATSFFVKSLDDLTPTFKILPNQKSIFLINEFPLIGLFSSIIIIFMLYLASFIISYFDFSFVKKFGLLLIVLIIFYFVSSLITLLIYNISAQIIGFNLEEATKIREAYNTSIAKFALTQFIIFFFTILSILNLLFFKHDKSKYK